jgi:N-acetylmuramoyl-L-alanine amidase
MTLARRLRSVSWLLAGILCAAEAAADAPPKRARARAPAAKAPSTTAPANSTAGPDAAVYVEAQRALATLKATPARQAMRPEWEKVVLRYRRVVARYPQSGYSDNALLVVGDLYREMARRFRRPAYDDDAMAAYRNLVAEYPSSRLGEKALFAIAEIERGRGDRGALTAAVRGYLAAYPEGPRAGEAKAMLKQRGRVVEEAALPSPPRPGLAQVFNLRFWSGESSTRVVLDVEKQVKIQQDRINDPDRLWIDLDGARLHPNLVDRSFPVGDGFLEKIRVAQRKDSVVRVVLDFKDVKDHTIFYLQNPTRLVIDVRGTAAPRMATTRPAPRVPDPIEPPDLPPAGDVAGYVPPSPWPSPEPTPSPAAAERGPAPAPSPPARLAAWTRHDGSAVASPSPSPTPSPTPYAPWPSPTPPPVRNARARPRDREPAPEVTPTPPAVNRAGSYSLARQLGLGARTIVIDAGHGGHDPGSSGRNGLQEKDLVLDVALRLEKLIRKELRAEVIMTRATDVFIPLEERTAIANSRGADLFLSIHANSSRNSGARGIETYFLSFAQDSHAEAVAARENAVSEATMKDLQNLVKAIALNSKIDESRDFAASVQEAMVGRIRDVAPAIQDRGVRTAPFYVLIGANMPSVLAEISFVSNPQDEKLLRTPEHRDRIAESLFEGVRDYLDSLNHARGRQLTGSRSGSTVVSGAQR